MDKSYKYTKEEKIAFLENLLKFVKENIYQANLFLKNFNEAKAEGRLQAKQFEQIAQIEQKLATYKAEFEFYTKELELVNNDNDTDY